MPRYTPPSEHQDVASYRYRSRTVRIGVWVLLIGVVALVFSNLIAALL